MRTTHCVRLFLILIGHLDRSEIIMKQTEEDIPFAYGPHAPALYFQIPDEEKEERCILNSDMCIIDNEHFFIVGNLELPVKGSEKVFSWDIWVSLSEKNFDRAYELWEDPNRTKEPAYFGWLCSSLPLYPETLHLKTHVHTREVGQRPFIELEQTEHPLAIEQKEVITLERVIEFAKKLL